MHNFKTDDVRRYLAHTCRSGVKRFSLLPNPTSAIKTDNLEPGIYIFNISLTSPYIGFSLTATYMLY